MTYHIIGDTALVLPRTPHTPCEGRVTIALPYGATLYLNGHPYTATNGSVRIPTSVLKAENSVFIRSGYGSCNGESLLWDGSALTPSGFDIETVLCALVLKSEKMESRIGNHEFEIDELMEKQQSSLFS